MAAHYLALTARATLGAAPPGGRPPSVGPGPGPGTTTAPPTLQASPPGVLPVVLGLGALVAVAVVLSR